MQAVHYTFYLRVFVLHTHQNEATRTEWAFVWLCVCTCCCCTAMWGVYTKDSSMWLPVIWLLQDLVIQQRSNPSLPFPSLPEPVRLYLAAPALRCCLPPPPPNRTSNFDHFWLESILLSHGLALPSTFWALGFACFSCWSKVGGTKKKKRKKKSCDNHHVVRNKQKKKGSRIKN